MELKLDRGFGILIFGMQQSEVIALLGQPDRKFTEKNNNEVVCNWNKDKFRLSFYMLNDNRLAYVRIKNTELTFQSCKIIGEPVDSVKKSFGNLEWEFEQYDTFEIHFNEKHWISLHADFGIVEQLEMGVSLKNEEEYNWPD